MTIALCVPLCHQLDSIALLCSPSRYTPIEQRSHLTLLSLTQTCEIGDNSVCSFGQWLTSEPPDQSNVVEQLSGSTRTWRTCTCAVLFSQPFLIRGTCQPWPKGGNRFCPASLCATSHVLPTVRISGECSPSLVSLQSSFSFKPLRVMVKKGDSEFSAASDLVRCHDLITSFSSWNFISFVENQVYPSWWGWANVTCLYLLK